MMIDTSALVAMTEANQNFSRVARLVDEQGAAVILKTISPGMPLWTFPNMTVSRHIAVLWWNRPRIG